MDAGDLIQSCSLRRLDAIRNSRNTGSHPLQGVPKEDLKKKVERVDNSRVKFVKLARKHKRPLELPMFDSPEEEDLHAVTKWEISIAQMAIEVGCRVLKTVPYEPVGHHYRWNLGSAPATIWEIV